MRNGPKKIIEFAGKFCSFERRRYLCTTKPIRWIHLRVRIRASHARHRGSNPLSTTKRSVSGRFFCAQLRVGAESFAGIPRGFSFRAFSRAGFFLFPSVLEWRVLRDSVCSQRSRVLSFRAFSRAGFFLFPSVLEWRVLPDGVCFQLPAVAMCRMFSNAAAVLFGTAAAALKLKVI